MSNNSTIKCPNCGHEFEANESLKMEIEDQLRKEMKEWKLKQEEGLRKREAEKEEQWTETLNKQKQIVEENIKKSLTGQYENELKLLKEQKTENEGKLELARARELEFLKKENAIKTREAELDILFQKKINDERQIITESVKKLEEEKTAMKFKELEKQREDYKKLAEEMTRKAEQGSMQLQGEVQELALEEMLRNSFPFDQIEEVAKGVKGADCLQTIRNNQGQVCGKIIYESKRTKAFTAEWIEKLKTDMRAQQADIAVIVTETLPKEMTAFGFKEGVWICRFSEVKALAFLLRDRLIHVQLAMLSQENKGDKMQMLYDYLTANEFRQNIEAVVEGFLSLKDGINKEKIQMEKLWKEREKQLEKVLLNTTQFYGSIKGIAGNAIGELRMLE